MGPAQAIRTCLAKSFQFSGRASRSEFWWFYATLFLLGATIALVDLGLQTRAVQTDTVAVALGLVVAAPFFSAAWRRLHDIDMPGYINLLNLAPLACPLVVLAWTSLHNQSDLDRFQSVESIMRDVESISDILMVVSYVGFFLTVAVSACFAWLWSRPSQPGPNQYGPSPRETQL